MVSLSLKNRFVPTLLVLALLPAAGCSTAPASDPQGVGVTRIFANVKGVT